MTTGPTVDDVKGVLEYLLERADFEGAAAFLAQVELIDGISGDMDFLELSLGAAAIPARQASNPLKVSGYVNDRAGEPIGHFLIWASQGKLEVLEYAEYQHEYTSWPALNQIYEVKQE